MTTVQPIHYTSQTTEWHRLAELLGFAPAFPPEKSWSEFDANGILAVHGADAGAAESGTTDLHFLVEDLAIAGDRLDALGVDVSRTTLDDVGDILTVTANSGVRVTVSPGARTAREGELAVLPIWYQEDLSEPRRILEALGLRERISSDSGSWIDFTATGGGLAALHEGEAPGVQLGLEYGGDLDALAERVRAAGIEASVVDEAYNRTLLVASPDGGQLWINGAQEDFYGFRRSS